MDILVIALSINPRPLLKLLGLIMESRVDTAGDNQNAPVIISNYRHDRRMDKHHLGLICFNGLESPIHLSIIFAYSWSSQNPGNVVRENQYWHKFNSGN